MKTQQINKLSVTHAEHNAQRFSYFSNRNDFVFSNENIYRKDKGKFFFYCCWNTRGAHIIVSGPGNESKIPSKFVTGRDLKEVLGGTRFLNGEEMKRRSIRDQKLNFAILFTTLFDGGNKNDQKQLGSFFIL